MKNWKIEFLYKDLLKSINTCQLINVFEIYKSVGNLKIYICNSIYFWINKLFPSNMGKDERKQTFTGRYWGLV